MSAPSRRLEVTAIRRKDCPRCGAVAGTWCVSLVDKATLITHPHEERLALVRSR